MNSHNLRPLLGIALCLILSSTAFAQKIRVLKAKGNQAVVEFSGDSLQPGNAYELTSESFFEAAASSRNYVINFNFNLNNLSSDAAGISNETDFNLAAQIGWNRRIFEFGPLVSFTSVGNTTNTTTTLQIGVFGDFNMLPNIPGEPFIYGVGGSFRIGQLDSGAGAKTDTMGFFVGPFAKWFPTSGPLGFRADFGYAYQKNSGGTGDTTATGLSANAGIIGYF